MSFNFSDIFGFSKFVNTRFVDEFVVEEPLIEIPVVPSGGLKSLPILPGEASPAAIAKAKAAAAKAAKAKKEEKESGTTKKKGPFKFEETDYGGGGMGTL